MRAITVTPGTPGSAKVEEVPEPPLTDGPVIVDTLAIGICGTDREIISGKYGSPPPGRSRLILGHESVGRVHDAPIGAEFKKGDLVVGIVRRPDPEPCPNCAVGEWDMCRNGAYTERGIKGRDGFASELYSSHPEFLVRIDPSLEPVGFLVETASVLAKAWEHIDRIGNRAHWNPARVLVTGAGPVGLIAALMGVQRGLEVHVLDRVETGPKPRLVKELGAHYHLGAPEAACHLPDIVIECTGVGEIVFDVIGHTAPGGIICLTGVSSGRRSLRIDPTRLNRTLVLENEVIFGSVNANRRHYELGAASLLKANPSWLQGLITRRVPIERWQEAIERGTDEVKTVIDFKNTRRDLS